MSRLGNPLINEVIIPMGKKDYWNTQEPEHDKQFAQFVAHPELAGLIAALYAPQLPAPAGRSHRRHRSRRPGGDPADRHSGRGQSRPDASPTFTGPVLADMLRLNTSITPASSPNISVSLGGDLAGFPNGRRVFDDVVTVELRAIAGAILHLVDPSFTPDCRRQRDHRRAQRHLAGRAVPDQVPLPRRAVRRLPPSVLMTHAAAEPAAGPSGPGTVVLELGPGAGALVLHTPPELNGSGDRHQPARMAGASGRTRWSGPGTLPAGTRYAAVYPGLPPGDYMIWRDNGMAAVTVTVTEGAATTARWPGYLPGHLPAR